MRYRLAGLRWCRPRHSLGVLVVVCAFLLLAAGFGLAGCARATTMEPLAFGPPPWSDGETTVYTLQDAGGATIGSAHWTWRRSGQNWIQSYVLDVQGKPDRGEVVVGVDLRPLRSWRELAGRRYEAAYGPDGIVISTTLAEDAATTTRTLRPALDALDNDQSLQVQRALPLTQGFATRYTDVIPTTGASVPVVLQVTDAETVTVPAGTFAAWRASLRFGGSQHDAWYAQELPHQLLKYRNRASGAVFFLAETSVGDPLEASPDSGAISGGDWRRSPEQPAPRPKAVLLLTTLLVQLPLMLIFPLALGWWIRKRYHAGWGVFAAGALTFVVSQAVHLPLNWALGLLGGGRGVGLWPLPLMALAAGLSAGLCEEVARWLGLRFVSRGVRTWEQGVQYGAGWGGAEAIILGAFVLVNFLAMVALSALPLSTFGVPAGAADQVGYALNAYWQTPGYMPVLGGLERVFAITFQIALTLLVVRAIARSQIMYLVLAIGAHAALDAAAVWGAATVGALWVEAGLAVLALAALWLIHRFHDAPDPHGGLAAAQPAPTAASDLVSRVLADEELARRADASRYE